MTPGQHNSILDGITRRSVIQIAQDLGYTVSGRNVARAEVYLADEVSGTAAELVPVRGADRRVGRPAGVGGDRGVGEPDRGLVGRVGGLAGVGDATRASGGGAPGDTNFLPKWRRAVGEGRWARTQRRVLRGARRAPLRGSASCMTMSESPCRAPRWERRSGRRSCGSCVRAAFRWARGWGEFERAFAERVGAPVGKRGFQVHGGLGGRARRLSAGFLLCRRRWETDPSSPVEN